MLQSFSIIILLTCMIQLYSLITHDAVLKGELYVQGFQKLIDLHLGLFTDCFMKIFPQSRRRCQERNTF